MDNVEDHTFWIALGHLPGWQTGRINDLIVDIREKRRLSFGELFEMEPEEWMSAFDLKPQECLDLAEAKRSLPEHALLAEELVKQGAEIVPIWSEHYPMTLKKHLKCSNAPPLLYTVGNERLLQESTVVVVGAHSASEAAMSFVEAFAARCSEERRVAVVSGFEKAADSAAALDSTLKYEGRQIIVLPQGILASATVLNRYKARITEGDVVMLSPFFPGASRKEELTAMCTVYLYALAEEIYVAEAIESRARGSTWEGIMNELSRGRRIYVRSSRPGEKNANELLIAKGGIPVDDEGQVLTGRPLRSTAPFRQLHFGPTRNDFETKIRSLLSTLAEPVSAGKIKEQLRLELDTRHLSRILKDLEFVRATKSEKGLFQFTIKEDNSG